MSDLPQGNPRLACFELWGGNSRTVHPLELPGLEGWVSCKPFGEAARGGDVHYISVCSRGRVSRIVLADVAGHGVTASAVADRLRRILQQHTNNWDQSALMRELNDAFKQDVTGVHFATAIVLGYYSATGELLFSNAGHLPLLWYHARTGEWDWLEDRTPYAKDIDGLPLGLISGTSYLQTAVELDPGDLLILYTDGITESRNTHDEELGRDGLLSLARNLDSRPQGNPGALGHALMSEVRKFRGKSPQRDDETLMVIQRGLKV